MYIVWLDYGTDGWKQSEEVETLEDCFIWLGQHNYGYPYKITKTVDYEIKEK